MNGTADSITHHQHYDSPNSIFSPGLLLLLPWRLYEGFFLLRDYHSRIPTALRSQTSQIEVSYKVTWFRKFWGGIAWWVVLPMQPWRLLYSKKTIIIFHFAQCCAFSISRHIRPPSTRQGWWYCGMHSENPLLCQSSVCHTYFKRIQMLQPLQEWVRIRFQ